MTIKYYLGIQSYANHDCGASIVKYNTKSKKIDYVCISEERLIRKNTHIHFLFIPSTIVWSILN